MLLGNDAAVADLGVDEVARLCTVSAALLDDDLDLLNGLLLPIPGVGEDRVSAWGIEVPCEVVQLGAVGAE